MARPFDKSTATISVVVCITVLLALLALNSAIVKVVLALLLVLFLPGYTITVALFPKRDLGIAERLLFVITTSMSVVIIGGLVLNATSYGLQVKSWVLLLASVTLAAGVVAWVRRKKHLAVVTPPITIGLKFRHGLILGLAVLMVGVALRVARTPAPQQGFQGYTQLWMLPIETNYKHTVRLGISSMEFRETRYKLEVKVNGQISDEWPLIELGPNEKWEANVDLSSAGSADDTIEAVLYLYDEPGSIYRRVTLWHDSQKGK